METQISTRAETSTTPESDPCQDDFKPVGFNEDSSEGSLSLEGSFEFDLGEETIPLKNTGSSETECRRGSPARTFSGNNLRSLTEQLSRPGREGSLPLSPRPKKKTLGRGMLSPSNSPGALTRGSFQRLTPRRTSSPGPLSGGSPHGISRSTGRLGGSLHGKSRSRCNSPGPLGGSLHGRSRTSRSSSPGPLSSGSLHGRVRPRSRSPGPLSRSSHGGVRSTSPGPFNGHARARSRSPGALASRSRSFRAPRRHSLKSSAVKRPVRLVSILRHGKFSQDGQSEPKCERSVSPVSTRSRSMSPSDSSTGSTGPRLRRRFSLPRCRRVSFWFHDEASLASSFATEESIQFGDLGLDDSGEIGDETGIEYGQRSLKGELPFIEVMDLEGYGEHAFHDADDYDYLANRFNASTIQEELGASSGMGFDPSSSSMLSVEEHKNIEDSASPKNGNEGSFLPISDLDDSSRHSRKGIPKCRARRPTPPPVPADSSFSSLPSEDSLNGDIFKEKTPRMENLRKGSESSLDLSSMKISDASTSYTKRGKDVSVASETSSKSPTGVSDLDRARRAHHDADGTDCKHSYHGDGEREESIQKSSAASKMVSAMS